MKWWDRPNTSWQIDGATMETMRDFILGAPNSLQMVTRVMKLKTLAPWKKNYDQPRQHIKKQSHYFANKGPSSQSYGFSIMYGCESWTVTKAECQRIDAFELWCWRRLLRVPWTARKFNQSILKEISPRRTDVEAGAPILWPPDAKNWLVGKDLDAGRDWGQEEKGTTGWDGWMASPTQWTWVWINSRNRWWTGRPGVLRLMGSQRSWTWLSDWTELIRSIHGLQPTGS